MEKIMTNGFCELNENEMMETNGGAIGIVIAIIGGIIVAGGAILAGIDGASKIQDQINENEAAWEAAGY